MIMKKVEIGKKVPDFSLPDQDGNIHKISDYIGSWILIYFYPKDDTPGCTKEACSIGENFPDFKKSNIKVFGISADSVKSHKKFAEKYKLPFTLLSDENKEVVNLFGVWGKKKFMGKEYMGINRSSFLVDPKGIIVKIYEKVVPDVHAEEVLKDVEAFMLK